MNRRLIPAIALALAVAPGIWWRSAIAPPRYEQSVEVSALALPPGCCAVGPVRIDAAWQLRSANSFFGGYSALVSPQPDRLLAISDAGRTLRMDLPGPPARRAPVIGSLVLARSMHKTQRDAESATRDPVSGELWIGFEGGGMIRRFSPRLTQDAKVRVPLMRRWPGNKGPEAMVRLPGGRFVILGEAFAGWLERRRHPALLFAGDPTRGAAAQPFTFAGYPGYRPTDMAALPDGRVLIVMRQLRWPFPIRFGARLMLADPGAIRPGGEWRAIDLGEIAAPLPVDNFEGLALVPQADGTVTGWLISDDNGAVSQRTLLLRLRIDPAKLPRR